MAATRKKRKKGVVLRRIRFNRLTEAQAKIRAKKWERMVFQTRYELEVFYRGYDRSIDRAVEKATGRAPDGTGMDLMGGLRDMNFEFKTERSALAAALRVKKSVRGARCMIRSSKRG